MTIVSTCFMMIAIVETYSLLGKTGLIAFLTRYLAMLLAFLSRFGAILSGDEAGMLIERCLMV
jgi:hypothetical protein